MAALHLASHCGGGGAGILLLVSSSYLSLVLVVQGMPDGEWRRSASPSAKEEDSRFPSFLLYIYTIDHGKLGDDCPARGVEEVSFSFLFLLER